MDHEFYGRKPIINIDHTCKDKERKRISVNRSVLNPISKKVDGIEKQLRITKLL